MVLFYIQQNKNTKQIESEEKNMMNFLDLLVIVFMILFTASLLSLCLMFLVRNPRIKKVCVYVVAALGIYAGSIGIRIGTSLFPLQTAVGVIAAAVSIIAIVLVTTSKGDMKKFKIAQFTAAAALIVGIINAFI